MSLPIPYVEILTLNVIILDTDPLRGYKVMRMEFL